MGLLVLACAVDPRAVGTGPRVTDTTINPLGEDAGAKVDPEPLDDGAPGAVALAARAYRISGA